MYCKFLSLCSSFVSFLYTRPQCLCYSSVCTYPCTWIPLCSTVSHAVKLHFVDITLAQSLSFPPSVNQSASVPCALNRSTLPLFCHLVSHSCSLPSPHLHVTLVGHIVVQASTCFISATMSTYTPGGPVLFPTTVELCYPALSESNHQIFYYSHSSINHAQFLQIDLSLMKYQILVLTDSLLLSYRYCTDSGSISGILLLKWYFFVSLSESIIME